MKCTVYDLEVMSLKPCWVELGLCSCVVLLSKSYLNKKVLACEKQVIINVFCQFHGPVFRFLSYPVSIILSGVNSAPLTYTNTDVTSQIMSRSICSHNQFHMIVLYRNDIPEMLHFSSSLQDSQTIAPERQRLNFHSVF